MRTEQTTAERAAFERQVRKEAIARHIDAPHGTRTARVRAEVSCKMHAYDVAAGRREQGLRA